MPKILEWLPEPIELPWEQESVAFNYDSQAGPTFFSFPMTGLLPINICDESEIQSAPTPVWVSYLEPTDSVGVLATKGDCTYRFDLPDSFENYLASLSYDSRKEMRYVLRKNEDLVVIKDRKEDLLLVCDKYFEEIRLRCGAEGETPFSLEGIEILKKIYLTKRCTTLSIYEGAVLLGVNVSFCRNGIIYDSCLIVPDKNVAKKKSLGNFAILKNIEHSISAGLRVYDMLVGEWGYKTKFGAKPQAMRQYIACDRGFALAYGIPESDICRSL